MGVLINPFAFGGDGGSGATGPGLHRYWGFRVIAANNPSATQAMSLNDAKMYAEVGGANLLTNTAKASATSFHPATAPAYLVDGNPSTYWGTNLPLPADAIWYYDFDTDVEIISAAVRNIDNPLQMVTELEVVFSDDASTWSIAWVMTLRGVANAGKFKYYPLLDFGAITLPPGFKNFAIQMEHQTSNAFSMAEVEMRVVSGGDNVVPLVTVVTYADYTFSTLTPDKAVDGNAATYWSSSNSTPSQKWWIEFDCLDPIGIVQLTIQANNDGTYYGQTPSDFVVMGQRAGGEWTPIWAELNHSWSVSEIKTFTCPFIYGDGADPVSP